MRRRGAIVRLEADLFVEWSSIVDAPVASYDREALDMLLDAEVAEAQEALDRARSTRDRLERNGHTYIEPEGMTPASIVAGNRAGPAEAELSWDELVRDCRHWLDS